MRYFVIAMGEDDFASGIDPGNAPNLISERLTWDSPVAVAEVESVDLHAGLDALQLERLGLL